MSFRSHLAIRASAAFLFGSLLVGCVTPPPANQPLGGGPIPDLAASSAIASSARSGRLLLILTFSGGGTRAAAFSYGVLQELAETHVKIGGQSRRLLDEVDLVSTVSGGSFTGAYFGLHGDGIFADYEDVFLRKNVEAGLALEVLRPRYWLGLLGVDRSQLAARYYDRNIFHDATIGDMRRRDGPEIIINATDLSSGGRFPFSPHAFALICSDFESYPVADAVTASSAVPIVFQTVRLRNYAGTCGFEPPEWVRGDGTHRSDPLRDLLRDQITAYVETLQEREYVHLLDGGLSDNLGLGNSVAALAMIDDYEQALEALGHGDIELILVITVNSKIETKYPWDRRDKPASAVEVVSALSDAQIAERNLLTVQLARAAFGNMAQELSTREKPVRFEMVEVSFPRVADPDERSQLGQIDTSFNLSDAEVDRLIAAARNVLREAPELADALAWLEERGRAP